MKPITKRILIASAALTGGGLIFLGIGMGMGGRPGVLFSKEGIHSPYQHTEPYLMKKTKIDAFTGLNIDINSEASIQILTSEDTNYYMEYLLDGTYDKPQYQVTDDTLYFSQKDTFQNMVGIFGISLGNKASYSPAVTLYIPKDANLTHTELYTAYGNIELTNSNLGEASIETDYGNVLLAKSTASTLNVSLSDGNFHTDTLTADSLTLKCEDGNADIQNVTLKDADITLEYGNLELDTKKLENLNCQMEYGNAELSLPESMNHYLFDIQLEYGNLTLPDTAPMELYHEEDGEVSYQTKASDNNKTNFISITSEDGDVTITEP